MTLSGVRRALERQGVGLRSAAVQHYSPDHEYVTKYEPLIECMGEAATMPDRVALVFLAEMGYTRWPEPGPEWTGTAPAPRPRTDRADSPDRLRRIIGALNAVTGRVDFLDAYIVGRAEVIPFYKHSDAAYPDVERLPMVQDNGSIHTHRRCPDGAESLAADRAGLAAELLAVAQPDREAVAVAAPGRAEAAPPGG